MSLYMKAIADQLFRRLEGIESGRLAIISPDGKVRHFSGKFSGKNQKMAQVRVRDWGVFGNFMLKGNIALAEDYRNGRWDTDDLVGLLSIGMDNARRLRRVIGGSRMARFASMMGYMLRRNTIAGSRKNIGAHYDLGNGFYELWLDPTMTYSSAIFGEDNESESLEAAQMRKLDRILGRLNGTSGALLEIGCGWGSFAARAAGRGDFAIKGITLSEEQHDYARRITDRQSTNIALEDYRHQEGRFDHIVSIEMFEAVGEKFWGGYFGKIASLLKKDGRAVIQTITMNEDDFPRYRKGGDFIRSYIFPGGLLPCESRFREEARRAGLTCGGSFRFGADYARTLEAWLNRFDANSHRIRALGSRGGGSGGGGSGDGGFDDGFMRLWRFYLAGCIAGFRSGTTDVMQIELAHE